MDELFRNREDSDKIKNVKMGDENVTEAKNKL